MKNILKIKIAQLFVLANLLIHTIASAQAPQGFNYQATVRNNAGALILNQNVSFKFNVRQNSMTGVIVYSENQTATTDDLGQVNLVVGQGTPTKGTFAGINWANGTYYLGIDLNTGSGYVAMGTTQLLSVPYALYARNSGFTIVNDNTNLLYDASNSGSYYKTFILNIPSTNFITFGKIRIFDANNQQIAPNMSSEGLNSISIVADNAVVISRMEIPILTINGWKLHVETF